MWASSVFADSARPIVEREDDARVAEREEEADAERALALREHLPRRVVDRRDVVGVEGVSEPERVGQCPEPGQRGVRPSSRRRGPSRGRAGARRPRRSRQPQAFAGVERACPAEAPHWSDLSVVASRLQQSARAGAPERPPARGIPSGGGRGGRLAGELRRVLEVLDAVVAEELDQPVVRDQDAERLVAGVDVLVDVVLGTYTVSSPLNSRSSAPSRPARSSAPRSRPRPPTAATRPRRRRRRRPRRPCASASREREPGGISCSYRSTENTRTCGVSAEQITRTRPSRVVSHVPSVDLTTFVRSSTPSSRCGPTPRAARTAPRSRPAPTGPAGSGRSTSTSTSP